MLNERLSLLSLLSYLTLMSSHNKRLADVGTDDLLGYALGHGMQSKQKPWLPLTACSLYCGRGRNCTLKTARAALKKLAVFSTPLSLPFYIYSSFTMKNRCYRRSYGFAGEC